MDKWETISLPQWEDQIVGRMVEKVTTTGNRIVFALAGEELPPVNLILDLAQGSALLLEYVDVPRMPPSIPGQLELPEPYFGDALTPQEMLQDMTPVERLQSLEVVMGRRCEIRDMIGVSWELVHESYCHAFAHWDNEKTPKGTCYACGVVARQLHA